MLRSRYRRITFFFGKVILGIIFWDLILTKVGLRGLATRTRPDRLQKIAIRFRVLATELGGVMIKVGQFLSSRVDVLPEIITRELANLQDEVAPEDYEDIRRVAEAEFDEPLSTRFSEFDLVPMAAASLGQVHKAKLVSPDGGFESVVVKVQRPNIENIIATDLAALKTVGRWLRRYRPLAKRADVPALLREFSKITYEEIDYLAEGKNAETFAANFKDRPGVRVPKVVWPHTTKRVLTLENVQAIKITDYEAISAAGISRNEVAQRLFETYLQQIFEDGFFHADPHPGNLFVAPPPSLPEVGERGGQGGEAGSGWTLTFVDFGMVGRVPPNIRAGLREAAIGIGLQDSSRLVKSYQMLGVLLPSADLKLIQKFEEQAFERFWGKSMAELQQISYEEMHEFAKEIRDVFYEMPFQMPENLIFLGRCVAILSGMCTGLNPDFNVWTGIAPFAQKIIREETTQGLDFWKAEIGELGRAALSLPRRLDNVLKMMESGDMSVDTPNLNRYADRLERTGRRLINAVVFATLFFSGVQLYLAEEGVFAGILIGSSVIALVRMALIRRRR